jgi:hypothetical protein
MNKYYNTEGAFPKSERKIVERCTIETPNTHIHERSLSYLGTGISIKGVRANLWSCKCFQFLYMDAFIVCASSNYGF